MSLRLKCRSCLTAFQTSDDMAGQRVVCPKCGVGLRVPAAAAASQGASTPTAAPVQPPKSTPISTPTAATAETTVFVPPPEGTKRRRLPRALVAALMTIPVLAVAGVVAWPRIQAWLHPVPPDPIEVVAATFLKALVDGDTAATSRLSTIDEPPGIRGFRQVKHLKDRDQRLKGSFRPIAAMHARIDEKFEYDKEIGRYTLRNPLGAAAETLDVLHEAKEKAKAEQDEVNRKIQSGNPEDLFDAAEKLGSQMSVFNTLAEGALHPKKLVPTYKQLVLDARPPLPPTERDLALDFASSQPTWDRLLKRPFPTLRADGPFILDRAEVAATVTDSLASSGDPPSHLRLKLVRFRLEGIDTGWKVVSARRDGEPEPPPPTGEEPKDELPPPSPGESKHEAPRPPRG